MRRVRSARAPRLLRLCAAFAPPMRRVRSARAPHGCHCTTDIIISHSMSQEKEETTFNLCLLCFKAFDSVSHSLLWSKLASIRTSSMILNLLLNMYGNAKSMVAVGEELSFKFPCRRGVRQNYNLSPLLLSLYVRHADLENAYDDQSWRNYVCSEHVTLLICTYFVATFYIV